MNNLFVFFLFLTLFFSSVCWGETFDSIQPTENLYQSIIKPKHKTIVLNLVSNFGAVEVPTSTIITHANNDFKIIRFEQSDNGKWHLARKDTILSYTDYGSAIKLSIQKNLAIKKIPERKKMIIVINVPAFWTLPETKLKILLKPWTIDRVGRLQEYTPGSFLGREKNFNALYDAIRDNSFAEPGMVLSSDIQKSFNLASIGDIYISKGLTSKLVSRSYTANKYEAKPSLNNPKRRLQHVRRKRN